eukprot:TRINITY_DN20188_c0_g1_i1.p1 TRINITY_DN20188_c0_g1~~TRINITY_DN20188_c0_g1_i1.p1  ORF type:complete len:1034 (-),score=123.75 TRINITY_DN20188_c0_g1_i1:138-3239(-)
MCASRQTAANACHDLRVPMAMAIVLPCRPLAWLSRAICCRAGFGCRPRLRALQTARTVMFAVFLVALPIVGGEGMAPVFATPGRGLPRHVFKAGQTTEFFEGNGMPWRRTQAVPDIAFGTDLTTWYDFTFRGEETIESEAELVRGNMTLEADILPSQIVDVLATIEGTFVQACSCDPLDDYCDATARPRLVTKIVQDMNTWGKIRMGMFLDWWLLAPIGGSAACADTMAIAGYGLPEPPFDVGPEPGYRKMLQQGLRTNAKTYSISVENWFVQVSLPICVTEKVIIPADFASVPPHMLNPDKICGDFSDGGSGAGAVLSSGDKMEWTSPSVLCEFALTPCICASIGGCTWSVSESGRKRCYPSPLDPFVACEDCPWQLQCPPTAQDFCGASLVPCTCVQVRIPVEAWEDVGFPHCYWNAGEKLCQVRNVPPRPTEFTPCTYCVYQLPYFPTGPEQTGCDSPLIIKIKPSAGQMLPMESTSDHINITFDRVVKWQLLGSMRRLNYGAIAFVCQQPPPSLPKILPIPEDRCYWQTRAGVNYTPGNLSEGDVLTINVTGTVNPNPTACMLYMDDECIVNAQELPCSGLPSQKFRYSFGLMDTQGPSLMDISPRNGIKSLPVDAEISFDFNEEVVLGPTPAVLLVSLGSSVIPDDTSDEQFDELVNNALSNVSADTVLDQIELTEANTKFEYKTMTVKFAGNLAHDTLYTIGLTHGSTADRSENSYAGMDVGEYVFRTRLYVFVEKAEVKEEGVPLLLIIIGGILVACLWCGLLVACALCFAKWFEKKMATREVEEKPPPTPTTLWNQEWNGSFHHNHSITEGDELMRTQESFASSYAHAQTMVDTISPRSVSPPAAVTVGSTRSTKAWRLDMEDDPMADLSIPPSAWSPASTIRGGWVRRASPSPSPSGKRTNMHRLKMAHLAQLEGHWHASPMSTRTVNFGNATGEMLALRSQATSQASSRRSSFRGRADSGDGSPWLSEATLHLGDQQAQLTNGSFVRDDVESPGNQKALVDAPSDSGSPRPPSRPIPELNTPS